MITLALLKYLAPDEALRSLVAGVLSVALLLTAGALLLKSQIRSSRSAGMARCSGCDRHLPAATIITGIIVGTLVTISSVGAGVLGTVALMFLYPRRKTVKVVGTDIAHAVPLTAVAGIGHLALGTVDLALLGSLLLGSLPGIYIGSHLGARVPEAVLRPVLATMLLVIGCRIGVCIAQDKLCQRLWQRENKETPSCTDTINLIIRLPERIAQFRDQVRRRLSAN